MQNYFKTMQNHLRSILKAFLINYKHFIFFWHFHHFLDAGISLRTRPRQRHFDDWIPGSEAYLYDLRWHWIALFTIRMLMTSEIQKMRRIHTNSLKLRFSPKGSSEGIREESASHHCFIVCCANLRVNLYGNNFQDLQKQLKMMIIS